MGAKILLLDIETAPSLGYVWGKYDQDVIEFERDWYILAFSCQWLEDEDVSTYALPDFDGYLHTEYNDVNLVNKLWYYLDAADIVVAHNGDSFDIKKANARFLIHKLGQPAPFKTVDTLKIARKNFKFDSNRLADLCAYLGIGGKVPHVGFALWKGCMAGDEEAWKIMREYNAQDVRLLKEIYLRLRPWCNHPDVNAFDAVPDDSRYACTACASTNVQSRGVAVARTRRYQRLHCQDCGKWFQGDIIKNG